MNANSNSLAPAGMAKRERACRHRSERQRCPGCRSGHRPGYRLMKTRPLQGLGPVAPAWARGSRRRSPHQRRQKLGCRDLVCGRSAGAGMSASIRATALPRLSIRTQAWVQAHEDSAPSRVGAGGACLGAGVSTTLPASAATKAGLSGPRVRAECGRGPGPRRPRRPPSVCRRARGSPPALCRRGPRGGAADGCTNLKGHDGGMAGAPSAGRRNVLPRHPPQGTPVHFKRGLFLKRCPPH